jgi:hypothetical protein
MRDKKATALKLANTKPLMFNILNALLPSSGGFSCKDGSLINLCYYSEALF